MDELLISGRYRVIRRLGEGGMGMVVLAEQTDLGRRVALKILSKELAGDPTVVERLRREAQAAASLSHPNVAQVYALEEAEGVVALAMELVEGKTLREILKVEQKLAIPRAVRIARQMLQGLAAAHAAGIVHRDIKPENVLVTADDRGKDQIKLADFGIARKTGASRLTERGMVIGTPSYLAPEQVRGEEADARSDLWAIGIVLYEMIAGERPFRGDDTQQLLRAIMSTAPPLLSEKAECPENVSAAVDRALRKDPAARFSSAKDMIAALEAPVQTEDAPPTKKERPATKVEPPPPTAKPEARPSAPATERTEGRKVPVPLLVFGLAGLTVLGWLVVQVWLEHGQAQPAFDAPQSIATGSASAETAAPIVVPSAADDAAGGTMRFAIVQSDGLDDDERERIEQQADRLRACTDGGSLCMAASQGGELAGSVAEYRACVGETLRDAGFQFVARRTVYMCFGLTDE